MVRIQYADLSECAPQESAGKDSRARGRMMSVAHNHSTGYHDVGLLIVDRAVVGHATNPSWIFAF